MLKKLLTSFRILAAASLLLGGLGFVTLQPASVSAAPVDVLQNCRNNADSQVCKGTGSNSLLDLMKNVINLLIMITGIIAVIMIIIGGIRYTTSAGDAGQAKQARDTIIFAVAGLVVAIMSFAIVNFVLARI